MTTPDWYWHKYTLLMRPDGTIRVLDRTGRIMAVRRAYRSSNGIAGVFVEFHEETGVFFLDEEIQRVDEF
jgi:hypothetical protein